MFRTYFSQRKPTREPELQGEGVVASSSVQKPGYNSDHDQRKEDFEIFNGYLSDISEDDSEDEPLRGAGHIEEENEAGHGGREEQDVSMPIEQANPDSPMSTLNSPHWSQTIGRHFPIRDPPLLKRRKLEIPTRLA